MRCLRLAIVLAAVVTGIGAVHAAPLNTGAFPKLMHEVRDTCRIDDHWFFLTSEGLLGGTIVDGKWELQQIVRRDPQETFWSLQCQDLLPGPDREIVVSRVRNGTWRSFVLVPKDCGWTFAMDEIPFALRHTRWQGEDIWVGDARFPQDTERGEFFRVTSVKGKLKLGERMKLPHGSVLDNWVELPNGEVAVLRNRHVEVFAKMGRWRMRGRFPGGGSTMLCTESQPSILSSIGEVVCRQLAAFPIGDRLLVPHNKILLDQVVSRIPMIDHGEMEVLAWDAALETYTVSGKIGPLPGELGAYFIDKNPVDGRDTLFLVVQVRSAGDAVGGLTHYSVMIPVPLDSLQK